MRRLGLPTFTRRSFIFARVGGIELAVHATWGLIFLGLVITARLRLIPILSPHASGLGMTLYAIAFALIFYLFVLAHELSHAAVARSFGLDARRVTLFFFGGVAQIGREARDPAQEYRVALAGPLSSLVLAAFLAMISRLLHPGSDGFPGVWGAFAAINLALAAFNLVPGFPLDGGRILRSAFWAGLRDRAKATRWAGYGGLLVAFALMVSGGVFLITGTGEGRGAVPGMWGLMLGFFLYRISSDATALEGGAEPGDTASMRGAVNLLQEPEDVPQLEEAPVAAVAQILPTVLLDVVAPPKPARAPGSKPRVRLEGTRGSKPIVRLADIQAARAAEPAPKKPATKKKKKASTRAAPAKRGAAKRPIPKRSGVTRARTTAKVKTHEGKTSSSNSNRRGSRPKEGSGSARASQAQPRNRPRHKGR